jgi:polyisoprenoid-binding protein YceI
MTETTQRQLDLTGTWDVDTVHSRLGFAARHAMVATVHGNFAVFSGVLHLDEADPTKSSAEVRVDAASVFTGNEQRDAHLRSPDFLDVVKYPELVFRSTRAEAGDGADEYRLFGDLTIRDQTHPVVLDLEFQGTAVDPYGNQRAGFEGKATINRKDWGLTWNVALETGGIMVGEKVKLELGVAAIRRKDDTSTE